MNDEVKQNYDDAMKIFDLPNEIILEIFSYLSSRDIIEVRLVCQNWHTTTQHASINQRFIYRLRESVIDSKDMTRNFRKIFMFKLTLTSPDFLFGKNIEYISMKKCTFTGAIFLLLLKNMKNLKSLILNHCWFDEIPTKEEILSVCGIMRYMKELKISGDSNYLNDLFETLIFVMPNIENMYIKQKPPTVGKFKFPEERMYLGVENDILLKHIKILATKLNYLIIDFLTNKEFINQLADIDDLQLISLTVYNSSDLMKKFLLKQKYLKSLIIYSDNNNLNEIFSIIFNNLLHLKTFELVYTFLTDDEIKDLYKLKKLEVLSLRRTKNLTRNGILVGLFKEKNNNLKKLTLENVSFNVLCEIAENFHNLRTLIIYSKGSITNYDIQMILKNLRWLRNLELCFNDSDSLVTDFGLTGKVDEEVIEKGLSITHLKGLTNLRLEFENQLTKECLYEIGKLKELVKLAINPIKIIVEDLLELEECKGLEHLYIKMDTEIPLSRIIFKQLEQYFPRLEEKFIFRKSDRYKMCTIEADTEDV